MQWKKNWKIFKINIFWMLKINQRFAAIWTVFSWEKQLTFSKKWWALLCLTYPISIPFPLSISIVSLKTESSQSQWKPTAWQLQGRHNGLGFLEWYISRERPLFDLLVSFLKTPLVKMNLFNLTQSSSSIRHLFFKIIYQRYFLIRRDSVWTGNTCTNSLKFSTSILSMKL